MRVCTIFLIVYLALHSAPANSTTYNVNASGTGDYATIQEAINSCVEGDTILLVDGTYSGIGNWDLDFGSYDVVVKSENGPAGCIIDCGGGASGDHRGFNISSPRTNATIIEGITIQNGYLAEGTGAGIKMIGASPTIKGCVIRDGTIESDIINSANGGGIYGSSSSAVIIDNEITGNDIFNFASGGAAIGVNASLGIIISGNHIHGNIARGPGGAGGILSINSNGFISDNIIEDNTSTMGDVGGITVNYPNLYSPGDMKVVNNLIVRNAGRGIYCYLGGTELINNTIYDNTGGGIFGDTLTVTNCILYYNNGPEITVLDTALVTYSWVEGGWPGTGNISGTSIAFETGPEGDFYLPAANECVDAGSDLAENICFGTGNGTECLNIRTTRTDETFDSGTVDMGFHYRRAPTTLYVPTNFATIQEAIDYAIDGDVVQVYTGIYYESINLLGKEITVRGNPYFPATTMIDAGSLDAVVTCNSGETPNTVIEGFTIQHGENVGGGFRVYNGSPTIRNCTIRENVGGSGGAMYLHTCQSLIENCLIMDNAAAHGGGIYCYLSDVRIENCVIRDNTADGAHGLPGEGGGIYVNESNPVILYTVIDGNTAAGTGSMGGGIHVKPASGDIDMHWCTLYGNTADLGAGLFLEDAVVSIGNNIFCANLDGEAIACSGTGDADVYCTDIYNNEGGDWVGCIADQVLIHENYSVDPLFRDGQGGYFNLPDISPCASTGSPGCNGCGAKPDATHSPQIITVHPMGAGDFSNIQAAINSANGGDTINLANGTYTGDGNRDINYNGKSVVVRSADGFPEICVIDCEASDVDRHRGVIFSTREGDGAKLQNVTVRNAYLLSGAGAGIYIGKSIPGISGCIIEGCYAFDGAGMFIGNSDPDITDCVFRNNSAANSGGGIRLNVNQPEISGCTFVGNFAVWGGGAIYNYYASPVVTGCVFYDNTSEYWGGGIHNQHPNTSTIVDNCTFCRNGAPTGGGIMSRNNAVCTVTNSIIAFSIEGVAVHCESGATTTASCADVYGNSGGNWTGGIAGQGSSNNNFSADPVFCDTAGVNLRLEDISPCTSANNPTCGYVGAYDAGCVVTDAGEPGIGLPEAMRLYQSYPNPFNPSTTIEFDLPDPAHVRLCVYNVKGELVSTLVDCDLQAGRKKIVWNAVNDHGSNLASGVYFYKITVGDFVQTRKIVLLR
jgi:predicted outer membrane repeat protein